MGSSVLSPDVDDGCWCKGEAWGCSGFSRLREGLKVAEEKVNLAGTP